MARGKVQLTSARAGAKFNSDVRVYDAQTGRLKRIETPEGRALVNYVGKENKLGGKGQ